MIKIITFVLIAISAGAQDTTNVDRIKYVYRDNLKGYFKEIAKSKSDYIQLVTAHTFAMLAEFDEMIYKIENDPFIIKNDDRNLILLIDERIKAKWKLPVEFYEKVHKFLKVDIPSYKTQNNP